MTPVRHIILESKEEMVHYYQQKMVFFYAKFNENNMYFPP
jgi:hypothetical protein